MKIQKQIEILIATYIQRKPVIRTLSGVEENIIITDVFL